MKPAPTASLFHEELYDNNKVVPYDLSVWRIAGEQKWNDKWTTYFYVAGYKFEDGASWTDLGGRAYLDDAKALQWALGVRYYYNPNVSFGLSYSDLNWKSEAERTPDTETTMYFVSAPRLRSNRIKTSIKTSIKNKQ